MSTQKSIDELLDLLDSAPEVTTKAPNKEPKVVIEDIHRFILFYNIKPGEEEVPRRNLYRLYRKWSQDPVISVVFDTYMLTLFTGSVHGYKIKLEDIDVSSELLKKFGKQRSSVTVTYKRKIIETFYKTYNVVQGQDPMYLFDLYLAFNTYNRQVKRKRLSVSQRDFIELTKILFQTKRLKDGWSVLVSKTELDSFLSDESLKRYKDVYEDAKKAKKKTGTQRSKHKDQEEVKD